jgi:hypothetical protein
MPVSLPAQLVESVKSNEAFALAAAMLAGAAFPHVLDDARVILGLLTSSPAPSVAAPAPNGAGNSSHRQHLPHKERAAATKARDKAILEFVASHPAGVRIVEINRAMKPAAPGTVRNAIERLTDKLEPDGDGLWRISAPVELTPREPWVDKDRSASHKARSAEHAAA